jgi:2-polyprenyl-3-methyl-5-hydroxy-6-metoxy-1,4-benzoquinol methylase
MISQAVKAYYRTRDDYGVNSLRRRKVLNLCAPYIVPGSRVLDLGCAGGYLGKELKTELNHVIGVDISEESVRRAAEVLDTALMLDVERDPWPESFLEDRFDLLLCAELLEHLFDPAAFLHKARALLRPRGALVLTTPNFLVWINRVRILLGHYGLRENFFDFGHIRLQSYLGLVAMVRGAGYEIAREDHVWFPCSLERLSAVAPPNVFAYQVVAELKVAVAD